MRHPPNLVQGGYPLLVTATVPFCQLPKYVSKYGLPFKPSPKKEARPFLGFDCGLGLGDPLPEAPTTPT